MERLIFQSEIFNFRLNFRIGLPSTARADSPPAGAPPGGRGSPASPPSSLVGEAPVHPVLTGSGRTWAAFALVERFDRRGIEPFELFRSEFGQNSWNPKKTTKSTVAKKTTSTKRQSTQNTRRGRTKGEKRETNCTEGARRTTPSHRSQRC